MDDDPDIRKLLTRILEDGQWYTVESFPHPEDVKRRLAKVRPSLLILDIMFPDTNVIDFLKYRASNPEVQNIPMIVLSGLKNKKIVSQVQTYKINDYHLKPIKPSVITTSIKRILRDNDPKDFMFGDEDKVKIKVPITFTEVSEVQLVGQCEVKLEGGIEYNIESDILANYEIQCDKLQALENSNLIPASGNFMTKF